MVTEYCRAYLTLMSAWCSRRKRALLLSCLWIAMCSRVCPLDIVSLIEAPEPSSWAAMVCIPGRDTLNMMDISKQMNKCCQESRACRCSTLYLSRGPSPALSGLKSPWDWSLEWSGSCWSHEVHWLQQIDYGRKLNSVQKNFALTKLHRERVQYKNIVTFTNQITCVPVSTRWWYIDWDDLLTANAQAKRHQWWCWFEFVPVKSTYMHH